MKREETERMRKDISEAFDFVRFLIKNPKMLRKVKNGAEIRFIPEIACTTEPFPPKSGKNTQFFTAETVYHHL